MVSRAPSLSQAKGAKSREHHRPARSMTGCYRRRRRCCALLCFVHGRLLNTVIVNKEIQITIKNNLMCTRCTYIQKEAYNVPTKTSSDSSSAWKRAHHNYNYLLLLFHLEFLRQARLSQNAAVLILGQSMLILVYLYKLSWGACRFIHSIFNIYWQLITTLITK